MKKRREAEGEERDGDRGGRARGKESENEYNMREIVILCSLILSTHFNMVYR